MYYLHSPKAYNRMPNLFKKNHQCVVWSFASIILYVNKLFQTLKVSNCVYSQSTMASPPTWRTWIVITISAVRAGIHSNLIYTIWYETWYTYAWNRFTYTNDLMVHYKVLKAKETIWSAITFCYILNYYPSVIVSNIKFRK